MADQQRAVRGRYELTGRLGQRTIDFWFSPPAFWRAEQPGEGLIFIADAEAGRSRIDDPLKPANEIQLLPHPRKLVRNLLAYTLIELGPLIQEGTDPATGRAMTIHPVDGAMGKQVGTATTDKETGWILGLRITEDKPVELHVTRLETGESWDRDLFAFTGWDSAT